MSRQYENHGVLFLVGLSFWIFVVPVTVGIWIAVASSDWSRSASSSGGSSQSIQVDLSDFLDRSDVWLEVRGNQSREALVQLREFTARLRHSLPEGDPLRGRLDELLEQQDILLEVFEDGAEFQQALYRYKRLLDSLRRSRRYY